MRKQERIGENEREEKGEERKERERQEREEMSRMGTARGGGVERVSWEKDRSRKGEKTQTIEEVGQKTAASELSAFFRL